MTHQEPPFSSPAPRPSSIAAQYRDATQTKAEGRYWPICTTGGKGRGGDEVSNNRTPHPPTPEQNKLPRLARRHLAKPTTRPQNLPCRAPIRLWFDAFENCRVQAARIQARNSKCKFREMRISTKYNYIAVFCKCQKNKYGSYTALVSRIGTRGRPRPPATVRVRVSVTARRARPARHNHLSQVRLRLRALRAQPHKRTTAA